MEIMLYLKSLQNLYHNANFNAIEKNNKNYRVSRIILML